MAGRRTSDIYIGSAWYSTALTTFMIPLLLTACAGSMAESPGTGIPAPPNTIAGMIHVADEGGNAITQIDLSTGSTRQVQLPISPHNVQISADGKMILAVGRVAGGQAQDPRYRDHGGLLLVLDPDSLDKKIPAIPVGDDPAHVVSDLTSRFAYLTDMAGNTVQVVDLDEGRVVRNISTCSGPHGLRMSPDGRELYVACTATDSVAVVDLASNREVARVRVGKAPVQVGFTPEGREAYVSIRDENRVAVIDTGTRSVTRQIPVGRGPIQLYSTPDGKFIYVANEGTRDEPDNTVSVIDRREGRVVETIPTGSGAHGVAISDDGRYAFITNSFANTLSVIEVATQRVVRDFQVGAGPAGVTFRSTMKR